MCRQLWLSPQINWDGKVLGCCHNNWQEFGGNAFADGLESSLKNSEKLVYARTMLIGKVPARDDVPCSRCEFYLRLRRGQWIRPRRIHAQMLAERLFPRWRQVYRSLRRTSAAPLRRISWAEVPAPGRHLPH